SELSACDCQSSKMKPPRRTYGANATVARITKPIAASVTSPDLRRASACSIETIPRFWAFPCTSGEPERHLVLQLGEPRRPGVPLRGDQVDARRPLDPNVRVVPGNATVGV